MCVIKINQVFFILYKIETTVNKTELTRPALKGPPGNTETLDPLGVQHLDDRLYKTGGQSKNANTIKRGCG